MQSLGPLRDDPLQEVVALLAQAFVRSLKRAPAPPVDFRRDLRVYPDVPAHPSWNRPW